jgi:hypothetical protein
MVAVRAVNRKSGYARDDKKERVVARKGRLLEERAVAGGKGVFSKGGWDAFSIDNRPLHRQQPSLRAKKKVTGTWDGNGSLESRRWTGSVFVTSEKLT